MLVEFILEYLSDIAGPDRATWRLWLTVVAVGMMARLLLVLFHVG